MIVPDEGSLGRVLAFQWQWSPARIISENAEHHPAELP
jgi:hypothetical protein